MRENTLTHLVEKVRAGNLAAFGVLVEATQGMAYAVAWRVLGSEADARDAVQEAYLTAFRRLPTLAEPDAFAGWLRRIVIATASNHRRRARAAWLPLGDAPEPPVLDADEGLWTDDQRRLLAHALLTLSDDDRRLCERRYHGGWTPERLAHDAQVDAAAMRKRLQRIRDKLRKEIEMDEKRTLGGHAVPGNLSATILDLLSRPRLVDIPDNPVGATLATLRAAFPSFDSIELPERVDLDLAERQLGGDAVYVDRSKLHRVSGEEVLRYDLSLPLLLAVRWEGRPRRLAAAGKVYRQEHESATHLEAFHQLELFAIDHQGTIDAWWLAGRILESMDRLLPRSEVRMTPTDYPMCSRAWSLDVKRDDEWIEVMAWGQYAPWVLRALGADPEAHVALGAGFGLERNAGLRYGIDDVRKMATARVS